MKFAYYFTMLAFAASTFMMYFILGYTAYTLAPQATIAIGVCLMVRFVSSFTLKSLIEDIAINKYINKQEEK